MESELEPTDDDKNQRARFANPVVCPISPAMCRFLRLPAGTHRNKEDVTLAIYMYIGLHRLHDGSRIMPDPMLKELLNVSDDVELTVFNMEQYLSPHFL